MRFVVKDGHAVFSFNMDSIAELKLAFMLLQGMEESFETPSDATYFASCRSEILATLAARPKQ